jgi:hypothetical protein
VRPIWGASRRSGDDRKTERGWITMDGAYTTQLALKTETPEVQAPRPPPIWSLQLVKAERLKILQRCAPGQPYYEQALHDYVEADRDLQKALVDRFGLDTVF